MNASYPDSGATMNQLTTWNLAELTAAALLTVTQWFLMITWAEGFNGLLLGIGGVMTIVLTGYRVMIAREDWLERRAKRRQAEDRSHLDGLD